MKKSTVLTFVLAAAALILLFSAAYTVSESEQVVIVRFGKVMGDAVKDPGLHFKVPFVDEARRFEKRWLEWDGDPNQFTTLDKRYIYIDVLARWRISEPLVFIEKVRDEHSAHSRLDDIIDSVTHNVIANHNLIEAIRSSNREFTVSDEERAAVGDTDDVEIPEPPPATPAPPPPPDGDASDAGPDDADAGPGENPGAEIPPETAAPDPKPSHAPASSGAPPSTYEIEAGRVQLTRLILEEASEKAAQLGIEVKDVQIKRINYVENVQTKVFDRMISERQRVAEAFRSQGQGLKAEILGRMEKELRTIRSRAYRKAEEIRGEADAEAAAVYAEAYRRDPDLYEFLKTLESYRTTVDDETWLLLTTDADYARHLSTMKGGAR